MKRGELRITDSDLAGYLEPTRDAGRAFVMRHLAGEVVMLSLLRFREIADYSATPELAPPAPISLGGLGVREAVMATLEQMQDA